jgi:cytochrome P450
VTAAGGPATPPGPTGADMLRAVPAIKRDTLGFLSTCVARHGDVVAFPMPRTPVWLVNDPDAVRRVLQDNHPAYDKRTIQYTSLSMVTGQGLLTSDPPVWLAQRRLAAPAFRAEHLVSLADHVAAAAGRLLAEWDRRDGDGEVVDVDAAMMRVTLDVIGAALFGADLGSRAEPLVHAVLQALDVVVARAQSPLKLPLTVPTPRNRRLARSLRVLDAAVADIVARRRAAGVAGSDLLGLLLAGSAGDAASDRMVRDQIVTMIIAGHETVASALTWTWHLLGTAPEAAFRLQAESAAVLGDRLPTYDDLGSLPFARQVLEESLRLYPPAWAITRRAIADDELAGHVLPAGSLVITSPWTLHRHRDVYADPERFDPDRWAPGRRGEIPRSAYIPFGAGPRLCIGREFALTEGVLLLAALSSRWSMQPMQRRVRIDASVTLRPQKGLPMRLHRL